MYYCIAIAIFAIVVCFCKLSVQRRIALAFLVTYSFILLVCAVFSRQQGELSDSRWGLFWTYAAIAEGGGRGRRLIVQIVVNIMMMIPIGVISPVVTGKRKLLVTALLGFTLSVSIEFLQYMTKRGLCELDDVFHNMIGILIGYGMYTVFRLIINEIRARCL